MGYMVAVMLNRVPAWRRAVTLLCLAGILMPSAVGAAPDPAQELEEVQDRLDEAQTDLQGVEQRKAVELSDLEQLDARRAELDRELADLNERLEAAEVELADSQAALDATTQELVATEAKLAETRTELVANQEAFAERARATYMYGGQPQWAGVLAGMDSISEFERGVKYARVVLDDDRRRVERITALEAVVERVTADLEDLQERRAAQRAVDAERRDAAAAIVAEREAVKSEADAEAEKRRRLVARLESDRRSYVAMVQTLEADSLNLEEELRRIAAEERAAQLAAERQAARDAAAAAARVAAAAPPPAPDPPAAPSTGAMVWPANGPVTSDFGWRTHPIFGTRRFHAGIDIGAGYGVPIVAAQDGVVVSAGPYGGYGNAVALDHGGGLATFYAHQASVAVSSGESVSQGQVIGYVGSTGYSTGPHLHFEVRVNGSPTDPMQYL